MKIFDKLTSKVSNAYLTAGIFVFGALVSMAPSLALALTWPPTAADITSSFTDVGDNIGEIIAAVATVGLVLYGGVVAIMAGIQWFTKFYRASRQAG